MCGIVGIWNFNQDDIPEQELDRFVDSLSHRGPDGRGIFRDRKERLSLGHRRLAILDLSPTGRQPMSYGDKRYWITYNGEIYNFLELRRELRVLGHRFISESDTEVILAAYAQWGEDCQLRFNGMWAFAIWDRAEKTLFLSRDRFGIKPLHYVYTGRYFAFASEIKSFLELKSFEPRFDLELVSETIGNINGLEGTEFCLLEGVKRLVGGHCLTIRKGQEPRIRKWWNTLDHLEEVPPSLTKQQEKFRQLFFDACRIRMRSDVPLATSLSGGLDSSSVVCTINEIAGTGGLSERMNPDWQRTFIACFPGTSLDEQEYAKIVVDDKKVKPLFTETRIDDYIDRIEQIVFQLEEIYWVLLAGLWINYKAMRENDIRISLDGHGADELLGGYPFAVQEEMLNALFPRGRLARYLELKKILVGFADNHYPASTFFGDLRRAAFQRFSSNTITKPVLKRVTGIHQRINRVINQYQAAVPQYNSYLIPPRQMRLHLNLPADQLEKLSDLNRSLYYYFHFTILPTILRNFDRASMAHGVEIRMPFMDWRLVRFVFSLPDSSKIGGGYTKRILREAMRNIVPEPIRRRRTKIGFTSPMEHWFKGPLKEFLLDTLGERDFLTTPIWNGAAIKKVTEANFEDQGKLNLEKVWPFLNAHLLIKQFKKHRASRE